MKNCLFLFTDVEEYDILSSDDVTLDDDDDSISLPGNENDEADMEYLIEKLGFYDLANGMYSITLYPF